MEKLKGSEGSRGGSPPGGSTRGGNNSGEATSSGITPDPNEPVMSIGVVAQKLGISPETLRLYEREGLMITHRTSTGRRLYSQSDLEWVDCFRNQIVRNKLNIAGIRLLLALMPCWDIKSCSLEERRHCSAFMNSAVVCWTLEQTGSQFCNKADCRQCPVYVQVCRAGKLDHMVISIQEVS